MMKEILSNFEKMVCEITRQRSFSNLLESRGIFVGKHYRKNKYSQYQLINQFPFLNAVTVIGKNYMLDAAFNSGTPQPAWVLGLIDGTAGVPTLSTADTMGAHTGWTEFITYNETVRQTWTRAAAATSQVVGTSASVYTIGAVGPSAFVSGGFVTSNNVKGGNTGVLWSTGLFPTAVPVQPTDVFKLGYLTGL